MAIVTISREFASGGHAIARKAAELLGYSCVDKDVIAKILAGYGLTDFKEEYEETAGIWTAFDARYKTMVKMLQRVAFSVARRGRAVLLGRGSFVLLAGLPGVLNVRLRAPVEWRVTRAMEQQRLTDRSRAEDAVRDGDRVRSSFLSSIYGQRWDSMEHFDLIMNTSKIAVGAAASWIAEAARALPPADPQTSPASRASVHPRAFAADPTLDEAVKAELGA